MVGKYVVSKAGLYVSMLVLVSRPAYLTHFHVSYGQYRVP